MENFRIIDKNEIENNVTLINASKKLKTRSHDFGNIKKNNISKPQEPVFEPSIKKEEQPIMNTQSINNNSYQKEEVKPNNLYGAMKEEQIINLQHIRDLENTYKGHGSTPKSPKEKEEVKPQEEETPITEKEFVIELSKANFSPEVAEYKRNQEEKLASLKQEILDQEMRIKKITTEYDEESNRVIKIKEEKKDITDVLNGMNSWQMNFFSKFKDDVRTKNLIDSIEDYFSSYRKDLEVKIRAEKNGEERKKTLGVEEKKAREDLSESKRQLNEYIIKTYPVLKEVNQHDEEIRRNEEKLQQLTGTSMTDSLLLNAEKQRVEAKRKEGFGYFSNPLKEQLNSQSEPVLPEINTYNNINTNNIDNNMFGGFKNSANDKTSKQAITTFDIDKIAKSRTNRQTVSEIKSPEPDYTNYFESRRVV